MFFVGILRCPKWLDADVLTFQSELRYKCFAIFWQLIKMGDLFQSSGHPADKPDTSGLLIDSYPLQQQGLID